MTQERLTDYIAYKFSELYLDKVFGITGNSNDVSEAFGIDVFMQNLKIKITAKHTCVIVRGVNQPAQETITTYGY